MAEVQPAHSAEAVCTPRISELLCGSSAALAPRHLSTCGQGSHTPSLATTLLLGSAAALEVAMQEGAETMRLVRSIRHPQRI